MFRVRSVALEVHGVIFYVLFSLGKRKGARNSKKEKKWRKKQEEGNSEGCCYPESWWGVC